jgi:hypothetical protein
MNGEKTRETAHGEYDSPFDEKTKSVGESEDPKRLLNPVYAIKSTANKPKPLLVQGAAGMTGMVRME